MKRTFFISILFFISLKLFSQESNLFIWNITEFNTFEVRIYEDERLVKVKKLKPTESVIIESNSKKEYRVQVIRLTWIKECVDCPICSIAERDDLGRAILDYDDTFVITLICQQV